MTSNSVVGSGAALGKQIHDHEQPPHILVDAEGVDRVGERRIVDDAAVPIAARVLALLDFGPGKLRRQAAARQHVLRLDGRALGLVELLVGEALQHAALHIDRGHHEGRVAGVELGKIDVAGKRGQQGTRIVDMRPARERQHVGTHRIEVRQAVKRQIPPRLARPKHRRLQYQIVPQRGEAAARIGSRGGADHASCVDRADGDPGDGLERDGMALAGGFVDQLEQRGDRPIFIGAERAPSLQDKPDLGRLGWDLLHVRAPRTCHRRGRRRLASPCSLARRGTGWSRRPLPPSATPRSLPSAWPHDWSAYP